MLIFLKLWKFGVGFLAGLAIGWIVFKPIGFWQGERFGRAAQDVVWQQREAEATVQRENERRTAQAQINRIETAYHQRDQARQADMAELERALQDAQANVETVPVPSGPCACRPAVVPRSLSNALGRVGAAAPRHDSAGSSPAVRGPR